MKAVRIRSSMIGAGQPCFIIAEAGSNHDGSLAKALRLIDAAAAAGADAVKFQLFRADRLYAPTAGRSDYLKRKQSIFEIIRDMELSPAWLKKLVARCGRRGMLFLASAFDEESADLMNPYVSAFKIASYEITHLPLIRHIARFGKPILISTGASDMADIQRALGAIRAEDNRQVVLFQCTAKYPAPADSLNLRAIPALAKKFGVPVGLSDHSADAYTAPISAVALGAAAVEKHFTLSRSGRGPDHKFSIEPDELADMVRRIRETEAALGDGQKRVLPVEKELHRFARRSIFTARPVRRGEILSEENLVILRNGKLKPGLPPARWERVVGRRAKRALPAFKAVRADDIAGAKPVTPIRLRAATASDARFLWALRRDPVVVKNSVSGRGIPWDEHSRWFSRVLQNGRERQWIAEDPAGRAIGQARLSVQTRRRAVIHVGIHRSHRGKGYGQAAICATVSRALAQGVQRIEARILEHNLSSLGAFKRAGFKLQSRSKGVQTWIYTP